MMQLTDEQKNQFFCDGFLIIKNFIQTDICNLLIKRAHDLMNGFELRDKLTIFSTKDQQHAKHQYFLDSATKIHFFFEENSIDDQGNLKFDKALCINKIGHALHDVDPVFNCFSRMHIIASLVNDLGVLDPLLLQSMYICKQPYIGGEVTCHQDSTYLYVVEQPVLGLWFALEEANIENGCLWAIPAGHQTALKSRAFRDKNNQMISEVYDSSPWPLEKMIPLQVPQGSLIVLHGLLPHMSKENTSSRSRHAYILHVTSKHFTYASDNWLQRPASMAWRGFC